MRPVSVTDDRGGNVTQEWRGVTPIQVAPNEDFRLKAGYRPNSAGTSCALKERTFERRYNPIQVAPNKELRLKAAYRPTFAGTCGWNG